MSDHCNYHQTMKPKSNISGIDRAFPTSVKDMLPPWSDIPDEFKDHNCGTKWNKIMSQWFFNGLPKGTQFKWKDGINGNDALVHLRYCLGSWEPKHEHKEAGVAYLMSQWLEDVVIPDNETA